MTNPDFRNLRDTLSMIAAIATVAMIVALAHPI